MVTDDFDDSEVLGYDSLASLSGTHWGKTGSPNVWEPTGLGCCIDKAWCCDGCCQFCMQILFTVYYFALAGVCCILLSICLYYSNFVKKKKKNNHAYF